MIMYDIDIIKKYIQDTNYLLGRAKFHPLVGSNTIGRSLMLLIGLSIQLMVELRAFLSKL